MSERTMDGLAAARTRGRTGGQKPKLTPRQARIAQEMYAETGPDTASAATPWRRPPPISASPGHHLPAP
jgi:DNA invertase Pin-like site-specific DNA recombinase